MVVLTGCGRSPDRTGTGPVSVVPQTLPSGSYPMTDCTYLPTPAPGPAVKSVPPPPSRAADAKRQVRLVTSAGTITLDLSGDAAPCTVNSFVSLALSGYFSSTPCHRLTTTGIYVLQCGDPGGSGTGGPGYAYGDENLPANRHPAYPRGTVAMANAGPATNDSQFLLVYKDSDIDPNYSVFGTITGGLDVLDRIAAGGTDDSNGTGDGRPKLAVTIESVSVS